MIGLIGILGTSLQRLAAFLLAICIMAPAIYTHVQANDGQFAPRKFERTRNGKACEIVASLNNSPLLFSFSFLFFSFLLNELAAVIMVLSLLLASGWSTGGKKSADPKASQKAK